MKNLFATLLALLILLGSCKKKKETIYPEFIIRHHLEKLHDLAKWELYQLNCLDGWNNDVDYLVNIQDASSDWKIFSQARESYEEKQLNILKDEEKIKEIFGNENVRKFIEFDLEWFEHDTTGIFKEDQIELTFFPKDPENKSYFQKITSGHYYTIIFEKDSVVGVGGDDYFEMEHSSNETSEKEFIALVKQSKKVNKWVLQYIKQLE